MRVVCGAYVVVDAVYTYKAIYTIYSRGTLVHLGSSHEGLLSQVPVVPTIIGIVRWIFGMLGWENSRTLPACLYNEIRKRYPSQTTTGYKSSQQTEQRT